MRDETIRKYTNKEITVVWKPDLCVHSAICWKGLGAVFQPNERPWVKMGGASSAEISSQVERCPSGALSWLRNDEVVTTTQDSAPTVIDVTDNGPLVISGPITLKHPDGREEHRTRSTALCRCGQSGKKPFCDGTHSKVGFKG